MFMAGILYYTDYIYAALGLLITTENFILLTYEKPSEQLLLFIMDGNSKIQIMPQIN